MQFRISIVTNGMILKNIWRFCKCYNCIMNIFFLLWYITFNLIIYIELLLWVIAWFYVNLFYLEFLIQLVSFLLSDLVRKIINKNSTDKRNTRYFINNTFDTYTNIHLIQKYLHFNEITKNIKNKQIVHFLSGLCRHCQGSWIENISNKSN